MRYYEIDISSNKKPILKFRLDESNPNALGIKFNIQQFHDSGHYSPSTLTFTNPPTSFYSQTQGLVGMDIKLSAGIKPSVFTSKLGLTESNNDLLYLGKISRVVPAYNGKNPSATFLLSNVMQGDDKEVSFPVIVEQGGKIAESIKKTLLDMFPELNVSILKNAEQVTLQDKQTFQKEVKNFSMLNSTANQLGIGVAVESSGVTLYSKKGGIERETLFLPKAQDFLSQPEWQNVSTLQCVFCLRGDIHLGMFIEMPPKLVINASSLTTTTGSLSGVRNSSAIIASGKYRVTGIWTTGDSRNSSALAWATTVSASSSTNMGNK